MVYRIRTSLAAIFIIALATIASAQSESTLRLLYRSTHDPALAGISFSCVGSIGDRIFASQQYFAIGNVLVEFQLATQSQELKVIDTLIVPATTFVLSKNKAYVAPRGYLVDISQPGNMRHLGKVPFSHLDGDNGRHGAAWINDTLLVGLVDGLVHDDRGGLEMFSIANPMQPRLLDFWNIKTWGNFNVIVRDTLAFLNCGKAFYIVSLASGKSLKRLSGLTVPYYGGDVFAIHGSFAYLIDQQYSFDPFRLQQVFLVIVDVSNPSQPSIVQTSALSFGPSQLLAYREYLFVVDQTQKLYVFSLAKPVAPELISQYLFPYNIYAFTINEENWLITANGDSGISIWELPFITAIEDNRAGNQSIPKRFEFNPIYPNPGIDQIQINYHLFEPAHVRLVIYNMLGEKIKTLVDNLQSARLYFMAWDGKTDKNTRASAGIYFAELSANGQSVRRKFSLIR